jgi:hypothetical protein
MLLKSNRKILTRFPFHLSADSRIFQYGLIEDLRIVRVRFRSKNVEGDRPELNNTGLKNTREEQGPWHYN